MFSTATSLSCDAVESQCRVYLQKWVCEHFGEHGQIHPNYAYPRKKLKTNHYIPHGQHLFVCFEASVDDIYREAPYGSFLNTLNCQKGLLCRVTWLHMACFTTSRVTWDHKRVSLLHQRCFYIFCIELSSLCLSVAGWLQKLLPSLWEEQLPLAPEGGTIW